MKGYFAEACFLESEFVGLLRDQLLPYTKVTLSWHFAVGLCNNFGDLGYIDLGRNFFVHVWVRALLQLNGAVCRSAF